MKKKETYRQTLPEIQDWDSFLLQESGLPGPRGNIELAMVAAEEGTIAQFERWTSYDAKRAPANTPQEFLAFCGVLGLGRLASQGDQKQISRLRIFASDPRWRTREAVAMGLQLVGDKNMKLLLREMGKWCKGSFLEQRAAAAALCEPRLLHEEQHAERVLRILNDITASIAQSDNRKSDEFIALRKGLGYCWSVAVAALPSTGKPMMENWFSSTDHDVRWIMKENLKKDRLVGMDADWVNKWRARLER